MTEEIKDVKSIKSKTKSKLSEATILTVITATLFLTGYLYDQGSLASYSLNDEYFPRTFQFYLERTFFVFLTVMSDLISYLGRNPFSTVGISAIFALVFLVMIFMVKSVRVQELHQKSLKKGSALVKNKWFDPIFFPVISFILGSFLPYILIIAVGTATTPLWVGFFKGKADSEKAIKQFKGCDINKQSKIYSCIFILKNKKPIASGLFIAKSDKHIALWDGSDPHIYPLKNDEEILIKQQRKKSK